MSSLRTLVCLAFAVMMPTWMLAADVDGAMLDGKGEIWLNGKAMSHSSAIFPGDMIQTRSGSIANINGWGSTLIVQPDSILQFKANAISLEHGSVSVATSNGMSAIAYGVRIAPASDAWTKFQVTDVDGHLNIAAEKGTVSVHCGKDVTTLAEGEQATRDESGKCNRKKAGAYPPTTGNYLTNPYVLGGIGGGALLLCLVDFCVTPSAPAPHFPPPSESKLAR